MKIEKGNKTTDWTPAPEDVDATIATAQATANGKNKVTYSLSVAGTTANTIGDIWFQKNASNVIIGQWEGLGGVSWSAKTIDSVVIANLDAAKITTGFLSAARIDALAITSDKLSANSVIAGKIAANAVTAGTIVAGTVNATAIATDAITAIKIVANTITGDKLVVDAITAREIAAHVITANEIVANTITAAEIKAYTITAGQIQAGTITTNELNSTVGSGLDISSNTGVTLKADKTYVDAIQIGGRNLALNSENAINLYSSIYEGSNAVVSNLTAVDPKGISKQVRRVVKTVGGGSERVPINTLGILSNRTFVFSVWVKSNTAGVSYTLPIVLGCENDSQMTNVGSVVANPTTWTRFVSAPMTYAATIQTGIQTFFMDPAVMDVLFCNIKFEEGNKATDWTPAPEDSPTNANIISKINLSPESITIDAANLNLTGLVTITNIGNGTTSIDGSNIKTGSVDAARIQTNVITAINNNATLSINAARLNLNGYITATNLSTEGQTTINGANITTGSISADRINGGTISGVTIRVATNLAVGLNISLGGATTEQRSIIFFEGNLFNEQANIAVTRSTQDPMNEDTTLTLAACYLVLSSTVRPKWNSNAITIASDLTSYYTKAESDARYVRA